MDSINYLDQEYMEKLLTNFSKATGLFIEAVDVYGKTFFTPLFWVHCIWVQQHLPIVVPKRAVKNPASFPDENLGNQ